MSDIRPSGLVIGDDNLARPVWASVDPLLREYYDTEWGMPVRGERALYERISLEAFQAGLSWATVLRKRPAFRDAFDGFDPDRVSQYDERDEARLLENPGIVRNARKVRAAIANAKATVSLREVGGLDRLVWSFRPKETPTPRKLEDIPTKSFESEALARELQRNGFVFVGPTSMFALMEAVGIIDTHLLESHRRGSSGLWSG
jgi:DNA-3-methyladenine glycosylase I